MRTLILAAIIAANVFSQNTQPIEINVNELPKTSPVGEDKTRLLKVDYSFETESILYGDLADKDTAASTILAGNFSFETIHYDLEGSILAKLTLTHCSSGPCGDPKPLYVAFVQGGNNLESIYIDQQSDEDVHWSVLFGIANTIYTPAGNGDGDTQFVPTVYGNCRVEFSRPEDKKFKRKINNCELIGQNGFNYTRFDGLETTDYTQEVLYMQNAKVDADISVIEAVEMFSVRNPLDNRWGFHVESRTHVEIKNRTRLYVDRHCNKKWMAEQCATEVFGAKKVGNKLYENVHFGEKKVNKFSQLIDTYREHLFDMGDSHTCELHSSLYAEIVREAREVEEQEWIDVIKKPENEPVLHVIGNVLGSLGNEMTLKIAREHLLVEGAEFLDDYLLGAANTINYDEKWHKKMMYWLAESTENKEVYWKVANTIATVFKRRCERTPSTLNACNKGKDKIVSKFIEDISKCTTELCHHKALDTLLNLPIAGSFELARSFLCGNHSGAVQTAALRLIRATNNQLYDSKLVSVLVKLFRNVCPLSTSIGESQLAIDVLIRCIPDHQNAATLILRTETMFPEDHEKWQYFYKAVLASGIEDELKAEFWTRMRQFKVFRPNYAHRSLVADSSVHWDVVQEVADFSVQKKTAVEFDSGLVKRAEVELGVKRGRKYNSLFGVSMSSSGLEGFVSDSATPPTVSEEPNASFRLSFLGHSLPTVNIFETSSEMMTAVWSADGQTMKAFEGNVILRDFWSAFPLLSGMTVDFSSNAAASLKILGDCEISLWNRDSLTNVKANVSVSFVTSVSLANHGKKVQDLSSSLSLLTVISTGAEASFADMPPKFCMTLQREATQVSFSTSETGLDQKKSSSTKRKTFPGLTLRMDEDTTRQCNKFAASFKF